MLSVIMCSRDAATWSAATAMYGRLLRGIEHEFVGIHDATGICEGYNRGIEQARGDVLLFSHDDIEFLDASFAEKLMLHLRDFDMIGIAGASKCISHDWGGARPPYLLGQIANVIEGGYKICFFGPHTTVRPAQIIDGIFMACRRSVVDQIRFDAENFPRWHGYDADFSFNAYRHGLRVGVASDLYAIHYSKGDYNDDWVQSGPAFLSKHHLPKPVVYQSCVAAVLARTKAEVLQLMIDAVQMAAEEREAVGVMEQSNGVLVQNP